MRLRREIENAPKGAGENEQYPVFTLSLCDAGSARRFRLIRKDLVSYSMLTSRSLTAPIALTAPKP
jgi:hypothetical protein